MKGFSTRVLSSGCLAIFSLALLIVLAGVEESIAQGNLSEAAGYAGSQTCALCHRDIAKAWGGSPHANFMREPGPKSVAGDFAQSPTLSAGGIPPVTVTLGVANNVYTAKVGDTTYTVAYAFGGIGWKERYLTKIGKSLYILPIQWNLATRQWVPYGLGDWYGASGTPVKVATKQSWDKRCAGCHSTGNIPAESGGEFTANFIEDSVGCESCHGPGEEHVSTLDKTKIVNPGKIKDFNRKNEVCGQCHLRGKSSGAGTYGYPYNEGAKVNFHPGDDLTMMFVDGGGYWPDGTSKQHHQQWLDWKKSKHNDNPFDQVACVDCHSPHGSSIKGSLVARADDNTLCISCHGPHGFGDEAAIKRHTGHTVDPAGKGTSRCTECHMPHTATSAINYDIRSHTFKFLSPEHGIKNAMPDSCTDCHDGVSAVAMSQPQAAIKFSKFCTNCHSETAEYKEWATSIHAKSLEDAKASTSAKDSCLKCMSADGRIADRIGVVYKDVNLTIATAKESISCSACHKHDSGLKDNLVTKASEICAECHSRQPKIFGGTGASGVADMPSEHSKLIPEKCVTCHMRKEGKEVVKQGGHTLKADVGACKACHAEPETMIAAIRTDVTKLLDGLKAKLDAATEEKKKTDAYKEANTNYGLVNRDGSHGAHNYSYVKAVLSRSYADMGATASISNNCATCHSKTTEYKEWETSAHAHSLETLRSSSSAQDRCLTCMGPSSVNEDPAVTVKTATAGISCSACHNHGSGLKDNLLVSAAENCVKCHTMGTAKPGGSPHHPQGEMFAGIGGAGVQKMESGHSKTMPDKCATCHMYKAGEEVAKEGGHTFLPTLESCKGCHADGASLMVQAQTSTTALLEGLKVALDAATDAEKKTDAYKNAKFNYDMIDVDGSKGVHNYAYADALLEYAYSALGVPMPAIGEVAGGEFTISLAKGLNMMSLPLKPETPYTARSLAEKLGATVVIVYDPTRGKFAGFTLAHTGDGFAIEGGKGYIVNIKDAMDVTFKGKMWTNKPGTKAAPSSSATEAWAFVVTGFIHDDSYRPASPGEYIATVKNLSTGAFASDMVGISDDGRFTVVWADLSREEVVKVGDRLEIVVKDSEGEIVSGPVIHQIDIGNIQRAFTDLALRLGDVIPKKSMLAQNYPNPFNPDTWIPYQLAKDAKVTIKIYNVSGQLVRIMDLGHKRAGMYISKDKAAHWDGRNDYGESVSNGIYIYSIQAGDFISSRKMVISR